MRAADLSGAHLQDLYEGLCGGLYGGPACSIGGPDNHRTKTKGAHEDSH